METRAANDGKSAGIGSQVNIRRSRARFNVLAMLVMATVINYADRATISLAGPAMAKDIGLGSVSMGYVFSAFAWAYVIAQIPGGWLLDRFGSRRISFLSILIWSVFTLMQGCVGLFGAGLAVYALFILRFCVGCAEAPSFPANARIVAAWFPTAERGIATASFNAASYLATVIFAPIMGWLTYRWGWPFVFYVMGGLGVLASLIWRRVIKEPLNDPSVNAAELDYLRDGGALVDLDQPRANLGTTPAVSGAASTDIFKNVRFLLSNRMLLGVYLGQYCITGLTYFFLTWFPVYLVQQRHLSILHAGIVASIPAVFGCVGGLMGGALSDRILRRTRSLTSARKIPIVVGMLASISIVICNYIDTQWMIVAFMAAAFFGKGLGALGWVVISDASPRQFTGLSGAVFNLFGNIAGITTPIAIGYIVHATGSFNGALLFVAAHALGAIVCYTVCVGRIERIQAIVPNAK